jgi:hypothetical protein
VVRDIRSNRRGGKKWQKASMWRMGPSCKCVDRER